MVPARIQRVDTSVFVLTGLSGRIVKRIKMIVLEVLASMEEPAMTRLDGMSASVLLGRLAYSATWKMSA